MRGNAFARRLLQITYGSVSALSFTWANMKVRISLHLITKTYVALTLIAGAPHLYGKTDVADSLEDEWLIVYLLRELSKSFPDIWCRVSDGADGEFLLVEAAEVLPRWLSPENDAYRVWMHNGQLRIIAEQKNSGHSKSLSLSDAVKIIETDPESLLQSPLIGAEAFYRLEKYPTAMRDSIHYAATTVPRQVAAVLHERPQIIAAAVEAFTTRTPLSIEQKSAEPAHLHFPRDDPVTVGVRFNKRMFAQMKSDMHPLPRASGTGVVAVHSGTSSDSQSETRTAAFELGLKVTAGFEILASQGKNSEELKWMAAQAAVLRDTVQYLSERPLPTDKEIQGWPEVARDDDQSWMNIDLDELDAVLQGRKSQKTESRGAAFGDQKAAEDLRKMVTRFEAFLNDESAGLDGAELHDVDHDDDEASSEAEDDDSEDEDKEVSFDEEQFANMMREMMGLPPTADPVAKSKAVVTRHKLDDDGGDIDVEAVMAQTEAELKEHNALSLSSRPLVTARPTEVGDRSAEEPWDGEQSDDDDEVDLDYGLAKNLLESLKSQGGLAGPAGNIMGLMGLRLPRDEDDDTDSHNDLDGTNGIAPKPS
jgi:hypothetical protein